MANETRPRREPTGTSRIRKTDRAGRAPGRRRTRRLGGSPVRPRPIAESGDPAPGPVEAKRDRHEREPYREEGPADREPIRFIPSRDREPVREPIPEREPGMSVRERLARDRGERDGGPIHHEGIPMARDRDRDRDITPLLRERARDGETGGPGAGPAYRERPDARDILQQYTGGREYVPPIAQRTQRTHRAPAAARPMSNCPPSFPTAKKISSATRRFTIATRTSSAARSISPSFRR